MGVGLAFVTMSTLVILILIYILFNQVQNLEKWQDIEHSTHMALLEMELDGYLSDETSERLESDLTSYGIENISFEGSSMSPMAYGDYIVLNISGNLVMFSNPFENDGKLYKEVQFQISKKITSKLLAEDILGN